LIRKLFFFSLLISTLFSQEVIQLEKKIYFEKNSYTLSSRAEKFLDLLAPYLKTQKDLKNSSFYITGHSDASGEERKNRELSLKRACEVKKYLVENHNMDESRFVCSGKGESSPVADNSIEEGRALNRRVIISKKGAKQVKKKTAPVESEITVEYEYDSLGRVKKAAYSNGHAITFEYDAAGNILRRRDFSQ